MDSIIDILAVVTKVVVYALAITYLLHIAIDWFAPDQPDLSDQYDYEEGPLRGNEVSHKVPAPSYDEFRNPTPTSMQDLNYKKAQLEDDISQLRGKLSKDTYSDLALSPPEGEQR